MTDGIPEYPWVDGELLYAEALNAAIASGGSSVYNVTNYGAKGDGVTDDTAAIQSVLNTYAGKGTVFVPNTGQPFMTSGITIPTGTDLLLHGTIMLIANSPAGVVTLNGASNVTIRGHGTIDGNAAAQATHPGGMTGLYIYNSSKVLVTGITVQNSYNWCLNVVASNTIRVDSVYIYGGGNANEFAQGSNNCWLTNSTIDGTGMGDYGFAFYGGVTNSGAIGNVVRNTGAGTTVAGEPGIGILSDTGQPAVCSNIVIADNIVHDCNGSGIATLKPVGGAPQTGILIANNKCYNNCKLGYIPTSLADCYIDNSVEVTVIGNQFGSGCGNAATGQYYGIYTGHTAAHVNIVGNQIFNVQNAGGSQGAAFWINNSTYLYVSGNYIYDDQATPTMTSAGIGTVGAGVSIINNFTILPFQLTWASDSLVVNFNQQGLNFTRGRLGVANLIMLTNTNSIPRWYAGSDGSTESGGNSGGNFVIESVNDAGSGLIAAPITITRSTSQVAISNALSVGAGLSVAGGMTVGNISGAASLGVWAATPPATKPTVTGAKGGNAALASLLAALVSYGFVTDSTTS